MTKSKENMDKQVELSPEKACEILKNVFRACDMTHRKIVKSIFVVKINMKLYKEISV